MYILDQYDKNRYLHVVLYFAEPAKDAKAYVESVMGVLAPFVAGTPSEYYLSPSRQLGRPRPQLPWSPMGRHSITGIVSSLDLVPTDSGWMAFPRDTSSVSIEHHVAKRRVLRGQITYCISYNADYDIGEYEGEPVLNIMLRTDAVLNDDIKIARSVVNGLIDVCESHCRIEYGLVHAAACAETQGGFLWHEIHFQPIPWHREIERELWLQGTPHRRTRLQSLYWGTILGPELRRRADPDGTLVKEYLKNNRLKKQYHKHLTRELPSGSLYIAMSHDPFDSYATYSIPEYAVANAAWFHNWLRARDLL